MFKSIRKFFKKRRLYSEVEKLSSRYIFDLDDVKKPIFEREINNLLNNLKDEGVIYDYSCEFFYNSLDLNYPCDNNVHDVKIIIYTRYFNDTNYVTNTLISTIKHFTFEK